MGGANRFAGAANRPAHLPANGYNGHWHHGNWHGHGHAGLWYGAGYRHGYGHGYFGNWWGRAAAWGLGAWALGSIFYDSGYGGGGDSGGGEYSNPYYASDEQTAGTYADYSAPLQTDYQAIAAAENPAATAAAAPPGSEHIDPAREAFKNGNYTVALQEVDKALQKLPKDAALHELRALVLFAMGNYSSSAGTLYAVLQAGPGWDWTTLSSLYPSTEVYTNQLRTLENNVRSNPRAPDAKFVLAYHYITCGHKEAAIKQLKELQILLPKDQLTAYLLQTLQKSTGAATTAASPPNAAEGAAASTPSAEENPATAGLPDIEASKLVGTWTGQRPKDTSRFTLVLTADSKFTWGYERNGKGKKFDGKYTTDGPMLVLERQDGGSMPGIIKMTATGFNFKMFGSPESDQGIDFKK